MDWNRIKVFLAVARSGSLSAAARTLHISVATAGRAVSALEVQLGFRLIDRSPEGIQLTSQGRALFEEAEQGEEAFARLERLSQALRSGEQLDPIRISATEPVIADYLAPALPALTGKAPNARVVLQSRNEIVSLALHEADIAVRLAKPEGNSLVMRKLSPVSMGLYASTGYLNGRNLAELDLMREQWLGYDDSYGRIAERAWMEDQGYDGLVFFQTSSTRGLLRACEAGCGIAILTKRVAKQSSQLVELPNPAPLPARPMWLLAHEDTRRLPAVRPVWNWLVQTLNASVE